MAEKRSGCKGCFIWFLCVTGFFLLLVAVGMYWGYRKFVAFRDHYTDTKPLALPTVRYSQTELDAVRKRIDQFAADAHAGLTNARLALTDHDLNALIASSVFSNRAYLTFTNDQVAGQFCLPLDNFGLRFFKGRFLNGAGILDVGCSHGQLNVSLKELTVNGMQLPDTYMGAIRGQNLAQGMTNDPAIESFKKVGRIAVEGGRLVIETRALEAEAPK
jgi:hypothetical protein